MNARSTKVVRCAIYTRVSTDQGLEQDFNSLDAQYDASQAYIRSQAHAGWSLLRAKYDDGGFSGGNTDRPALAGRRAAKRGGRMQTVRSSLFPGAERHRSAGARSSCQHPRRRRMLALFALRPAPRLWRQSPVAGAGSMKLLRAP